MKTALYVIPYPKFFSQHAGVGGHVAHAAGVVNGLVDNDYHVTVFAEESHDIFSLENVDVVTLPCGSQSLFARQLWAIKFLRQIRLAVKEQQFNVCYIRYSASFAPWIPTLKKILGKIPLILEVNSLGSQWRPAFRFVDRRALLSVDRVICISQVLKGYIEDLLADKATSSDVRAVINGVNLQRFDVPPANLKQDDHIHAGFAGLLKADYGLETLIETARLLRSDNIVIDIYGDGPHRDKLEEFAKDVPNIHFHGPVPFVEMPAYLKALDVLIYTTDKKHLYQSPTKLFEYMAAGKPIVSARTPQTEELLQGDETALFFEVGDAPVLADRLRALSTNQTLRDKLAQQARAVAEREHAWSARIKQIFD